MSGDLKKGFTLIELLVVVGIISVLSSVVLSSLNNARANGRDVARIRSLNELRTAVNMFFSDKGKYPYISTSQTGYGSNDIWKTQLINGGYIKFIHPEIKYWGGITTASSCGNSSANCQYYVMGVSLEKNNNVLKSDKDSNLTSNNAWWVDGISTSKYCMYDTVATASTDLCYDLASF